MPYSVPPPPPPAVVEVQPSVADDVDAVNQPTVDLAADDRQVGRSPQSSAEAHWPSLLSAPDVFAREFSGSSAIAPGMHLEDYDNGQSEASLLWGPFNIGSEAGNGVDNSGVNNSGTGNNAGHDIGNNSAPIAYPPSINRGGAAVVFSTTPIASLEESALEGPLSSALLLSSAVSPIHLEHSSPWSDSGLNQHGDEHGDNAESVVLDQALLNNTREIDADTARRSVQMSDDLKTLAAELLLPLEDAFYELYEWAQQVEQSSSASIAAPRSPSSEGIPGEGIPASSANTSLSQTIQAQEADAPSPGESSEPFFDEEGFGPLDPGANPDEGDADILLEPRLDDDGFPDDGSSEEGAPSGREPLEITPSDEVPLSDDALDSPPDPIPAEPIPIEPLPPDDGLDGIEDGPGEELEDSLGNEPDEPPVTPEAEPTPPDQPTPPPAAGTGDAIELTADRQIYDTQRRVFIAEGNVELVFRGAILNADRVQVNLPNKVAVAEGDVFFTRGEQVLRGDRIEYNLVLEEGTVQEARGEVFVPGVRSDLAVTRTDASARADAPPLSDQLARDQPPVETATAVGGLTIGGSVAGQGGLQGGGGFGDVRQFRFEADTIDFYPEGWDATNVRITNDPFSPPELELRAETATFRRLSPTRSELVARRPRLVFDQGLAVPLFRRRFVFDEEQQNAGLIQFGFDETDRGGLFAERNFEVLTSPIARLTVTPQVYIQRWFDQEPDEDLDEFSLRDAFGFTADLTVNIDPKTTLDGQTEFTSLDFSDIEDEARGSVRVNRQVLPIRFPFRDQRAFHTLTAEYSYRDRLFNGTLGFQTVQETYGLVFTSPTIRITEDDVYGQGLDFFYQAAIQRINSSVASDVIDDILGPPPRENDRATLNRYQVAAGLQRFFFLWVGTPLPATPEEGLKYTPSPVVPFIGITPRVQGIASFYESGDSQPILTGEVALQGQFGHFSRPFLDYFGFGLSYRRSTEGSESPFNFDRLNDREVFSASATAQLVGPLRGGIRTSINLDQNEEFDTSFFLEYSRRTYGIVLNYNPDREIGSLGLRLSDFSWTGVPEPFDTPRNQDAGEPDVEEPDAEEMESLDSESLDSESLDSESLNDESLDAEPLENEVLNESSLEQESLAESMNDSERRAASDGDAQDDDSETFSDDDVESSGFLR